MTRSIVVLGAGGHGSVVVDTILALGWSVVAVYDDDEALHGTTVLGAPVVGSIADADAVGFGAVVAVADNGIRRQIVKRVHLPFQSVVHPAAMVGRDVTIGDGTVVFAGSAIQPGARIGMHCIVNTGAQIDHHSTVDDFAHVGPGATLCGRVAIEASVLIGAASVVLPGASVGHDSVVGAGAVVARDIAANSRVKGSPAR